MIKLTELLNESNASDQAKKLGLDFMSFGRYGKNGEVTHVSRNGELIPIENDMADDDEIEPLPSLYGTGSSSRRKNSAHLVPRLPSMKKRIKSRISPSRFVRHNMGLKAPKGLGYVTNPKKAVRNIIYNFLHTKII